MLTAEIDPWMTEAGASLIASFATGITKDKAAVRAAIVEPWSNGQTEGQITKLKLVKRQMYGRAKIDLLQARLTGAAEQHPIVIEFASEPSLDTYLHVRPFFRSMRHVPRSSGGVRSTDCGTRHRASPQRRCGRRQ